MAVYDVGLTAEVVVRRRKSGSIPKTVKRAVAREEDVAEEAVLLVGVTRTGLGEHAPFMGGKEAYQVGGEIGVNCRRVHFYFGIDLMIESRRHIVALSK